ncbi:MAG: rhomboid family intramembrane serine protease [Bacteroidia bacterium]|nr:rhomboid family intramembrane serine protease [Bacteroidia bacterium]
MKLKYNAPVILTYTLISTIVLALQNFTGMDIMTYFTIYPILDFANPVWYFRLFSHAIGHGDWTHLAGNFSFILLLGPILEEKYGSRDLFLMMMVTALVTGILQIAFFENPLLGASGIVFMLILLSSFTNSKGGIPLTFVLVVVLYLGKEIQDAFAADNISQFIHIIGGVLGGLFGFFLEGGQKKAREKSAMQSLRK